MVWKKEDLKRPFKNRRYKFVGVMATAMSGIMALLYIIPGTNCTLVWQEWIIVGGWALLGILFAIWSKKHYKEKFATGIGDGINTEE